MNSKKPIFQIAALIIIIAMLGYNFVQLLNNDEGIGSQFQELDQIDRLLEENRTALEQADRTTFGMDYKDKAEQEKEWQKAYALIIKNEKRIWKIREKMWELKP